MGVDDRRGPTLKLPRTSRCNQDVPIVAVESIYQLHRYLPCTFSPILTPTGSCYGRERSQDRLQPFSHFLKTAAFGPDQRFGILNALLRSCALQPFPHQNRLDRRTRRFPAVGPPPMD